MRQAVRTLLGRVRRWPRQALRLTTLGAVALKARPRLAAAGVLSAATLAAGAWLAAQPVSVINDAYSYDDTFNDNLGIDAAASTNWQNLGGLIQANAQSFQLQSPCFSLPQPSGSTFDGWLFADLMITQTANLSSHRLQVQDCSGNTLVTRENPTAGGASIDLRAIPATTTSVRLRYTATHTATPNGTTVLPVRVDFWRVFGQATGPTAVTVTSSVTGTTTPGTSATMSIAWSSTGARTRNAVLSVPLSELNGLSATGTAVAPDDGLNEDAEHDYGNGAGLMRWWPIPVASAGNASGGVVPTLVNPGGSTTVAGAVSGELTWNLGDLAAGSSGSASAVVTVPIGFAAGKRFSLRARMRHGATPLVPIAGLGATMAVTTTTPAVTVNGSRNWSSLGFYQPLSTASPGATGMLFLIGPGGAVGTADLEGARWSLDLAAGTCRPIFRGITRWSSAVTSDAAYPWRQVSGPAVGEQVTAGNPVVIHYDRLRYDASYMFQVNYDVPASCADGQTVGLNYSLVGTNPSATASRSATLNLATSFCHSGTATYGALRASEATATGSTFMGGEWSGQLSYQMLGGHARPGEYFVSWAPYGSESSRTHTVTLDRTYSVLTVQNGVTFHGLRSAAGNYVNRAYKDSTGTAPLPGESGFSPLADPPHPAWKPVTVNTVSTSRTATVVSSDPSLASGDILPFSDPPNDANPSAVVGPGARLMFVKWTDNPPWVGPDWGNFRPNVVFRVADGSFGAAAPAVGSTITVLNGLRQWSYKQGASPNDTPQLCVTTSGGTINIGATAYGVVRALVPSAPAVPAGGNAVLTLVPENRNTASARVDGKWVVNLFSVRNQIDLDQVAGSVLTAGLNVPAGGNAANIVFTPPSRTACLAAASAADPACMAVWTVPPDTQLPNLWGSTLTPYGGSGSWTLAYQFRLSVPILRSTPAGSTLSFTGQLRNAALTALGPDNAAPTSLHSASNYESAATVTVLESPQVDVSHSGPANWPRNGTFTWVATVANSGNAASNGIYAVSRLPVSGVGPTQFTPGFGKLYVTRAAADLTAETSTSATCFDQPTSGTWTALALTGSARAGYLAESAGVVPAGSRCVRVRRNAGGSATFAAGAPAFGYALDISLADSADNDGRNVAHRAKAGALQSWGSSSDLAPIETADLVTQQNATVVTTGSKTPVPDLTRAGYVRWDTSWRNSSGTASGAVTVTDTFPAQLVFDSLAGALPANTTCSPACAAQGTAGDGSGGTLTLVTSSLAADDGNTGSGSDERSLGLWTRVKSGVADGTAVSNCLATTAGAGTVGSNQCFGATTAALTLTMTQTVIPSQGGSPPLVSPNDTLRYTLTIVNNAATAQTIRVHDALPDSTTYVAGSFQVDGSGASDAAFSGNVLNYASSAPIAAGATHTLRYDVRVRSNAVNGSDILNTANVTQCTDSVAVGSCRIAKATPQVQARVSATASINGTVFEDVNYGGGAGRNLAGSLGVPRGGVSVELYAPDGSFAGSTTTQSGTGQYTFTALGSGDYTVRVVTSTVTSSRSGSAGAQWPVQTFRVSWNGTAQADDTARVGGERPDRDDAGSNTSSATLDSLTTGSAAPHSVATVRTSTGAVSGVDFGFHFGTVVNTRDSGQGSLRQVLANANALGGDGSLVVQGRQPNIEHVVFMIGNGSSAAGLRTANNFFTTNGGDAMVATITLASALPAVSSPLVVDAQTQPGWSAANPRPIVEINAAVGQGNVDFHGLRLSASGSAVRGLIVNGAGGRQLAVTGSGNLVQGCWLGPNAAGTGAPTNGVHGLSVAGAYNVIGGTGAARMNVVSGNSLYGVVLETSGAVGNTVIGNRIGTNAAGTAALPNNRGVGVLGGSGNAIGGGGAGEGNLISGNATYGVHLESTTGATVQGNRIGTNAAGSAALGNGTRGVYVTGGSTTTIGGSAAGQGNLISGNGPASASDESTGGVIVDGGATGVVIAGNTVGLGADGSSVLANGKNAITITGGSSATVGGATTASRNIISGNRSHGVAVNSNAGAAVTVRNNWIGVAADGSNSRGNGTDGVVIWAGSTGTLQLLDNVIASNGRFGVWLWSGSGHVVRGNLIGVAADGTTARPNNGGGVRVEDIGGVTLGGTGAGEANTIASNPKGVMVTSSAYAVSIRGNAIRGNTTIGIDLGDNGSTANDGAKGAANTGPNQGMDSPVIYQAVVGASTLTAVGHVGSAPQQSAFAGATVDLYESDGTGQGRRWLGQTTTDANGAFLVTLESMTGLTAGTSRIVATATDTSGNTSEFSAESTSVALQAFRNGSFETVTPVMPSGYLKLMGGSTALDGWVARGDSIDSISAPIWTVSHGTRSMSPAGGAPGAAMQTFLTVPGQSYTVRFMLAGDVYGAPTVKTLRTTAPGRTDTWTFDTTGRSKDSMGWTARSFTFVATSEASTVQFEDLSGTSEGAAIDNVSMEASRSISGTVFEDVNYGGGAGRARASAPGAATVSGARVELYEADGTFAQSTTTGAEGSYAFTVQGGASYTVRVVNGTVRSTRAGSVAGLLPVQTYRTQATGGTATGISDRVGGENPALADAGDGSTTLAALGTASTAAQSVSTVTVGAADVAGVDFGFNFSTVVNTNDAGAGSLRQAITNANALGSDVSLAQAGRAAQVEHVVFMIPNGTTGAGGSLNLAAGGLRSALNAFSGGVATISPASSLPVVNAPLVIDAQTQPGWTLNPIVELSGANAGASATALQTASASLTVRGLIVNRWSGYALYSGAGGLVAQGNWFGLDATGNAATTNGSFLVTVAGGATTNALIGGTTAAQRNVISGATTHGVLIQSNGNTVSGNYIGTNASGTAAVPNGSVGVRIRIGASNNTVGGTTPGAGNVISGNGYFGVWISEAESTGNALHGNVIGLAANGTTPLGNVSGGVRLVDTASTIVGGVGAGEANTIASNGGAGVSISSAGVGNVIRGNVMRANAGQGIDLGENGTVLANDGTIGSGANRGIDSPVFTSASLSGTSLTVAGYVGAAADDPDFAGATVDVYVSDPDASGFGEGRTWIGALTADGNGNYAGTLSLPTGVVVSTGMKLTSTATLASAGTSEFGPNALLVSPNQMVLTVDTSAPGATGTTVTLPLRGTVNVSIDWGGVGTGVAGECPPTANAAGDVSCTYASPGTYTIAIGGTLGQFGNNGPYGNANKITGVTQWGTLGLTSLNGAFHSATNLTRVPATLPATVVDLMNAFHKASSFNDPNVTTWNTANVTNMSGTFYQATAFNQPIGGWNTGKVTTMAAMFAGASAFNQPIAAWDTSKVTSLAGMFSGASAFNQPIGTWNVGAVGLMRFMFKGASAFNQPIGTWNTASVTEMQEMFDGATVFDQDIGGWATGAVTNMSAMFRAAATFNRNLSRWCVPLITGPPSDFATSATAWTNPAWRPQWGTCAPLITRVGDDDVVYPEETGVAIAGSRFGASQGTGKVELASGADYASATKVAQTVAAWSGTAITITVNVGALPAGPLYLFVTDGSGQRSAGWPVRVQAANGLAAWWKFDETSGLVANDASGYGGHGTLTNMSGSEWARGPVGGSLGFDGVNDYVVASAPMTPSFTVSVWAKSNTANWNTYGWVASARGANGFIVHPDPDTRALRYFVVNSAGEYAYIGAVVPADIRVWRMYTMSYDAVTNTARVYLDGVLAGSQTVAVPRTASATTVHLGRDHFSSDRLGNGRVDDARIYQRALSDAEVSALYAQRAGGAISGTVFEDVNYGGGGARDRAAAVAGGGGGREGSRVELYDGNGAFIDATTTAADGRYAFTDLASGNYSVRVVNRTVRSGRGGFDAATHLPVQTFRTDAGTGTAVAVTDRVGGESPAKADAGPNTTNATLASLGTGTTAAQSVAPVTVAASAVDGVDFGFNFSTIVNANDAGQGSLRQFVINANAFTDQATLTQSGRTANVETSIFQLPTTDPGYQAGTSHWRVALASALPPLTRAKVALDASTQTGTVLGNLWAGTPHQLKVAIDGGGQVMEALTLAGDDQMVRGFVIGNVGASTWEGSAIRVTGGARARLLANFVGVDVTGSSGSVAGGRCVYVSNAVDTSVGGAGDADGNLVAGNCGGGSTGALVMFDKVTGVSIVGNFLGSNALGTAVVGSRGRGINHWTGDSTVREIRRNLIVGSTLGIALETDDRIAPVTGSTQWTIAGNHIGVGRDGRTPLPNTHGIWTQEGGVNTLQGLTIGGTAAADANVISGNSGRGIDWGASQTSGLRILGNRIGRDAANAVDVPNGTGGIQFVRSIVSPVVVGGVGAGQANVIAGNGGRGIELAAGIEATVTIRGNSVYGNAGGGIDLGADGVTANDGAKTAGQPNQLMDFPVLTTASLSGSTLTVGGYVGTPSASAAFGGTKVDVYVSEGPPGSNGQGRTWIGSVDTAANTGTFANASFNLPAGVTLVPGTTVLTATATDAAGAGNTSEFGPNLRFGRSIAGTVFEDANYGGGPGRSRAASGGVGLPGATVELLSHDGTLLASATTDTQGGYVFQGLAADRFLVRVVQSTVRSARSGSTDALRGVQTFRQEAAAAFTGAVVDEVGGQDPAVSDPVAGTANHPFTPCANEYQQCSFTGTRVVRYGTDSKWNTRVLTGGALCGNAAFGDPAHGAYKTCEVMNAPLHSVSSVSTSTSSRTGIDFGFNFSTVVNANDAGPGSLRQAIANANALGGDASLAQPGRTAGIEHLVFMIPNGTTGAGGALGLAAGGLRASLDLRSGGVATISPGSALPAVTAPLVIDARTQPGWTDAPVIALNGTNAGASASGLAVSAPGSGVGGLAIGGFAAHGVQVTAAGTGTTIAGNRVGTNVAGSAAVPNGLSGIRVEASDVVVGGTASGEGNLVSGNGVTDSGVSGSVAGVAVVGAVSGVRIEGNRIGLTADGLGPLPNRGHGVYLSGGAAVTVGGPGAPARNLIAGNQGQGVYVHPGNGTAAVTVRGNWLGLAADGVTAYGNTYTGTRYDGTGSLVFADNVSSANGTHGLRLLNGTGHAVRGNLFGLTADGTQARGNTSSGVYVDADVTGSTIGGTAAGDRNVIAGTVGGDGISLLGSNSLVRGNRIGTDATGTQPLGNAIGIALSGTASGNTIGGDAEGAGNLIAGNTSVGVQIGATASANVVAGNRVSVDATGAVALRNGSHGVQVLGDGNTVGGTTAGARNVVVNGTSGEAIVVAGSGNTVSGNTIGLNAAGTASLASGTRVGVLVSGASSTIGGTVAGAGNVISGNGSHGVRLSATATGAVVAGNTIGLNAAGDAKIANGGAGVRVEAAGARIGGTTAAERNVISGNATSGVWISADSVVVTGNYVGTSAAGGGGAGGTAFGNGPSGTAADATTGLGTSGGGVYVQSGNGVRIGGTTAAERNVISGNLNHGIHLASAATNADVLNNHIGTNPAGSAAVGNAHHGVQVDGAAGAAIGSAGAGNVISGNGQRAIAVTAGNALGVIVRGNRVGTAANDLSAGLPNGTGNAATAITVFGGVTGVTIGGSGSGEGNVVKFNAGGGVGVHPSSYGVAIQGNVIAGNAADRTPVQLSGEGAAPTLNDGVLLTDGSAGNRGMDFPVITRAAVSGSRLLVAGFVGTASTQTISGVSRVEVFRAGPQKAPLFSPYGVDQKVYRDPTEWLGTLQTDETGRFTGEITLAQGVALATGERLVAMATHAASNTSEVSDAAVVNPALGGRVFEDVRYGGGAGRAWSAVSADGAAVRPGVRVELYDGAGAFVDATETDGAGRWLLPSLGAGTYTVRVVASTVGSSRPWAAGPQPVLPVVTFLTETDASGAALPRADRVGGATPALADAPANTTAATLASLAASGVGPTAIATATVPASASTNIDTLDMGFSFNTVVNVNDSGQGSLRQAIANASALGGDEGLMQSGRTAGRDHIVFMIPNGSTAAGLVQGVDLTRTVGGRSEKVATIALASGLSIGTTMTVDAQTQPGWNPSTVAPVVELVGTGTSAVTDGVTVAAPGAIVRGLAIGGFGRSGVRVAAGGTGAFVQGNWVGLAAGGTPAAANGGTGLAVDGAGSVTIGGLTGADRNVVSGNAGWGVEVRNATGTTIRGNRIGTRADGTAPVGNAYTGVVIGWGSNATIVGGIEPGAGNLISGNGSHGVIVASGATTLEGNLIGTNAEGTAPVGNAGTGIWVGNPPGVGGVETPGAVQIGGTVAAARNVVSGNATGIRVDRASAAGTAIQGNRIGTDLAGATAIANAGYGIVLEGAAPGVLVGGTDAGAGNLISGNGSSGVLLASGAHTVQGNRIGTRADGLAAIANGAAGSATGGVHVTGGSSASGGHLIGGTDPAARNLLSGNGGAGVWIDGTPAKTTVQGNWIGVNASGATALGNVRWGVVVSFAAVTTADVQIGGTAAGAGNVISGNPAAGGVFVHASGVIIEGNRIGLAATGSTTVGNGAMGVEIRAGGNNRIGGTAAGAGNLISGNQGAGVAVNGTGTGNRVLGNAIWANGGVGIDLGGGHAGVSPGLSANDGLKDTQSLPNRGMDYPVLTSVKARGNQMTLAGHVGTQAGQSLFGGSRVELFVGDGDTTGHGEGRTFLGALETDAQGNFSGTVTLPMAVINAKSLITATATDAGGNTSEFGPNFNGLLVDWLVNSAGDAPDAAPGDGLCETATPGECTLRAAIMESNASAEFDTIAFALPNCPGAGCTIRPATPLPSITHRVTIDGTSQPGWTSGTPRVTLDGALAGASPTAHGLELKAGSDGSTVRALRFIDWSQGGGIHLVDSHNHVVEGSWFGLDASGTVKEGTQRAGILVRSVGSGHRIGGADAAARNVIAGSTHWGVYVYGPTGTVIQGNHIGTDAGGITGIANSTGVAVYGPGTRIGGTQAGEGNLIAGNWTGVLISTNNGNATPTGTRVEGNRIGAPADGSTENGNTTGVRTDGSVVRVSIGGTEAGAANAIAFNVGAGVAVAGGGRGPSIRGNAIYGNGGQGIDLGANATVLANDGLLDGSQPSHGVDHPILTSAGTDGTTLVVSGYIGSTPGQNAFAGSRVEVFLADGDASGYGEGAAYLGHLIADGEGRFSGSIVLPQGVSLGTGMALSATATVPTSVAAGDLDSATSEFGPGLPTVSMAELKPNRLAAFDTDTAAGALTGGLKTRVAGQSTQIDVLALNATGSGPHPGFSGAVTVEWLRVRDNAGALNTTTGCRDSWLPTGQTETVSFTAGIARRTVSLNAPSVSGREWRLQVRTTGADGSQVVSCSSDAFAVRPVSLAITGVSDGTASTAGTTRPLTAPQAVGGVTHRAGRPFTLEARALNAGNGVATGYDGTPTVQVTCTLPASGCTTGVLAFSPTASAGLMASDQVTYSEVGAIEVTLVDENFAAIDAADTPVALRRIVSAPVQIGRFVPDRFVLSTRSAPVLATQQASPSTPGTGFTFVGQPFGWSSAPVIEVQAVNAAGDPTRNWTGALQRLPAGGLERQLSEASGTSAPLRTLFAGAPQLVDEGQGKASLRLSSQDRFYFERSATAPAASFEARPKMTVSVRDDSETAVAGNDAITSAAPHSLTGSAPIGFSAGATFHTARLVLGHAFGDARRGLALPVELQRYTDRGWLRLADDAAVLSLPANAWSYTQGSGALSASRECRAAAAAAALTLTGGRGLLRLPKMPDNAPAAVTVTLNLKAGTTAGAGCDAGQKTAVASMNLDHLLTFRPGEVGLDHNPAARAVWGRPHQAWITRRELF